MTNITLRSALDRLAEVAAEAGLDPEQARTEKNWAESDRIRDQLTAMGVVLEDGKGGTTWRLAE